MKVLHVTVYEVKFSCIWSNRICSVPGPCEPEDLIDGIIFAANYLGSTQLLSERNPSKNIRMMQAQEAVSRVKVESQTITLISERLEYNESFY